MLPLPVDFAPTQQLPLRAGTSSSEDLPEALAVFAGGPSSAPAAPLPDTAFHAPESRNAGRPVGKMRAFLVLTGGFALAAAAGWFVASSEDGPGGGSMVSEAAAVEPMATKNRVEPVPAEPVASAEPAAPMVASPASAPEPASPHAPEVKAVANAPAPRPAKATHEPAKAPVAKQAPVARAPESGSLFAACEALNFISRSRCQVDICMKPGNGRRSECGPVLEQQRLVEQKRNPQLAY
ncbi:hypothetical protein QTH91_22655 [Variovorax dokdonensis]|uniref:Fe-S oxidoreductase n=1 Tax=Variovorax dokdonensis TaxID=344883 RepID=A0ABT7NH87_9BURK|nr:hypothetical protein [Variovorax dokdonensis]MDM0047310.1 hypothetical protein [Variovorax dokdonensis]